MNQYLTPEQRSEFERQLAGGALTNEEKQAAFQQGAQMARADLAADAPAAAPSADADALARSGFNSVQALLDAYVGFLEDETLAHPGQWYQFYRFFGACGADASPRR